MPIYEFACESCGNVEEHLQRLSDPAPAACSKCGGKMSKIMSLNSFQLKGGGWYKDLYSSSNAGAAAGKEGAGPAAAGSSGDKAGAAAPSGAAVAGSAPASPSGGEAAPKSSPAPAAASPKPDAKS